MILIFSGSLNLFSQNTELTDEVKNYYRRSQGNLLFHNDRVSFGGLLNTETKVDSFEIYNAWDQVMTFETEKVPSYITLELPPSGLQPGEKGIIKITYDAVGKNEIGPVADYLYIVTNDDTKDKKRLICNPNIREDFSNLSPEERANAPKIVFENDNYDFGTITSGEKASYAYVFKNEGGSDLIIRRVKSGCGCTATNPEKTVIAPGESSSITATFDSRKRTGKQSKSVTVITNDPEKPVTILRIGGMVNEVEE